MIVEMNSKIEIGNSGSISEFKIYNKEGIMNCTFNVIKRVDLVENKIGPVLFDLGYDKETILEIISKIKQVIETICGDEEIKGNYSSMSLIFSESFDPKLKIQVPFLENDDFFCMDSYQGSMKTRVEKLGYSKLEAFEFSAKINKIQNIIWN